MGRRKSCTEDMEERGRGKGERCRARTISVKLELHHRVIRASLMSGRHAGHAASYLIAPRYWDHDLSTLKCWSARRCREGCWRWRHWRRKVVKRARAGREGRRDGEDKREAL